MATSKGPILLRLHICLIVFSSLFIILRFSARGLMTKALGLDDVLSFLAYSASVALTSMEITAVRYGAGQQITDVPPEELKKFFSLFPTMQLLFIASTGLTRGSIVAFLPRLWKEGKVKLVIWGLGFAVFAQTVICFSINLFECKHVPDLWDSTAPGRQCLSRKQEAYMFWSHAAVGVLIDLLLLILPLWIIYTRMMVSPAKKRVLLVFSIGLFVLIVGVIRLCIIVTTDFSVNTTMAFVRFSIWTNLEVHVGLWVACFPTMQPLLRIITHKLGLSSTGQITTYPISGTNATLRAPSWRRKSQGYVEHCTEARGGGDISDDSSRKDIIGYESRECGAEMNNLGVTVTAG